MDLPTCCDSLLESIRWNATLLVTVTKGMIKGWSHVFVAKPLPNIIFDWWNYKGVSWTSEHMKWFKKADSFGWLPYQTCWLKITQLVLPLHVYLNNGRDGLVSQFNLFQNSTDKGQRSCQKKIDKQIIQNSDKKTTITYSKVIQSDHFAPL